MRATTDPTGGNVWLQCPPPSPNATHDTHANVDGGSTQHSDTQQVARSFAGATHFPCTRHAHTLSVKRQRFHFQHTRRQQHSADGGRGTVASLLRPTIMQHRTSHPGRSSSIDTTAHKLTEKMERSRGHIMASTPGCISKHTPTQHVYVCADDACGRALRVLWAVAGAHGCVSHMLPVLVFMLCDSQQTALTLQIAHCCARGCKDETRQSHISVVQVNT